jgi:hypothetical protein
MRCLGPVEDVVHELTHFVVGVGVVVPIPGGIDEAAGKSRG